MHHSLEKEFLAMARSSKLVSVAKDEVIAAVQSVEDQRVVHKSLALP